MANKYHPYHPVIYVRGFAGTQGEIEETVADPYMGFNVGSTKARRVGDGTLRRFFFESPIVRLRDEVVWVGGKKTDLRYDDVYVDGEDLTAPQVGDPSKPLRPDIALPYQSIVIFRYYDESSVDFGTGTPHGIPEFAGNLSNLILRLRELVCRKGINPITGDDLDNEVAPEDFRVYLVAHSMGGLICRAFVQNANFGHPDARRAVDKVFTYASPHNGIDFRVIQNVPGWSALLGEATNFNRKKMADFFDIPETGDVSRVTNFNPERIFNLVGTNPADYLTLKGLSSWAVGEMSDGLVRMDNATTFGLDAGGRKITSPRAYVHRSHSGHYGIVNSEEGYQNLTRFLFGTVRADGHLDIDELTLPDEVQDWLTQKKRIRAAYKFEIVATVRGSQWQLHRRTVRENSAIERKFDELFPEKEAPAAGEDKRTVDRAMSPHLFSVFLDPTKSMSAKKALKSKSVSFAFDLSVVVPDYEVDGVLWRKRHYEGGYIFRDLIIVEATPDTKAPGGYRIAYGFQSQTPNLATKKAEVTPLENGGLSFSVPVHSKKDMNPGIQANLRITLRPWA